nr:unnamed protein product [Digitaria exilis]
MEALVGRAVRKAFPGFGTYAGVVESYDADAGYFRVLYEDGDSEDVDADEMAGILVGPAMPPALQQTPPRDVSSPRRPKKRRRGDGESPSPAPHAPPGDGVVLAVPAADGGSDGETEPATRAEASREPPAVATEKKRRLSPGPVSSARPVRRSARQAKAAERAAEMEAAAAVAAAAEAAEAEAAAASTPQQSGRKRPRVNGSGRYRSVSRDLEEAAVKKTPPKPVLPPKPELPPSSQGLDLGGLPVLDVFQVYSCLRSFSRQLFLSPFPLDTFVAALHSTFVNPLIDCVHFALLRALKSHLEDFANEGDPSAVHCIRNLNWELLDLATWPIYLAEYLLTRGTELRYGMKLTDLKLLSTEYYRQPAVVKLELLRSLSDDVLEIGAIRSRMSEADGNDEGFRRTGLRRKKRGSYAKGAVDSSQSPEGSDEMDDGRLNGLLTGPWQNPQYHIYWRKAVLKALDVSSLKQPLLMLESSLRRVAISGEWQKPADSVEVVGSAAHILVRSSNKSSSHGTARKPGRKPSSNGELKVDSRDVGVYWWRGGKLSRQVFHWKRLPQSLVYKAARQAGRRKIPTILYTDGSQFARRFKYIAWQAAVEMAENVAQLILQIKELEWNIKWTEILGTLPSSLMTKEMQKIARLFKKVIIRRKRIEGTNVEYLLDFGKRENIPPVISKYGKKFEEPSSERNREAVNCQYCAALFHRKHFKVPRGATDAVYVCNKCLSEKNLVVTSPQKKAAPKKSSPKKKQKKQKKQSHKIMTRRNQIVLKYKKKIGKKGKRGRPRKSPLEPSKNEPPKTRESEPSNVPKDEPVKRLSKRLYNKYMKGNSNVSEHAASCRKRKRTALQYSYWLNGLRWTQNPHDERAGNFRKERVVFPSEGTEMSEVSPVCCLCEKCYSEEDIYIACENCEDWFHGDIYSVTIENVNNLIGFKCHRCLMRSLPVCPFAQTKSDKDHGIKFVPDEVHKIDKFVADEDHNSQKDVGAHGSQKDLHDHSSLKKVDIESRLNGHITEKELSDNNCLEELDDHNNLKEVGTRSNEEELDENKSLKELGAHNELKELDSPGSEKEPVNDYCPKELDDPINLKDLDSCRADRELKNHNYLNELDGRYYWKGLNDHNSQEELYGTPSSKFAAEGTQCPTELNGFNGLKVDNHNNLEELNSHNCPVEIDNKNSSKEPDNNRSPNDSCDFLAEHFNNIRISGKEALIVTPETGPVKESPALQSKDDSEKTVPAEHDIDFHVVVT